MTSISPMKAFVISREELVKIAGRASFEQGQADFQRLVLSDFVADRQQISGSIAGYRIRLNWHNEKLEGSCTCPDSEGFEFCRHCVSLALHANKLERQRRSLANGPEKSKILAYLLALDKQALAQQCMELITADRAQFKRFLLKASLDQDHIDYAGLKAQITQLTRNKEHLFSQRQVKHFFARIDNFLEELMLSDYDEAPERMLKIVEYALHRINLLLDRVDDSSEQREASVNRLRTMYTALFNQLTGRPEVLAKRLQTLWLCDRHGLLGDPVQCYAAEPIYTKFLQLTQQLWQQSETSALDGAALVLSMTPWQQEKIARLLLAEALKNEDVEQEQHYRRYLAKTCATPIRRRR